MELQMGFYRVAVVLQWDAVHKNTHTTQNNADPQTKHSKIN
jgi:hypothetical protein